MPLPIDLHVKCPFYKKWNKKKTPIISRKIITLYLGSKYLYSTQFLSQGAVKKKNIKCPQFTKVMSEWSIVFLMGKSMVGYLT